MRLNPGSSHAALNLAGTLQGTEAARVYRALLERRPDLAEAHLGLARVLRLPEEKQ